MAKIKPIKPQATTKEGKLLPPLEADQLQKFASLFKQQLDREKEIRRHTITKTVLCLAALGATLPMAFVAPNTARVPAWLLKQLLNDQPNWKTWKRFNPRYLRHRLHQLDKEGLVQLKVRASRIAIMLTDQGMNKLFDLSLDQLIIPRPKRWDGKWRIVIYDIPIRKRKLANVFQTILRRLHFYQLQKSVYLFPYPCDEVINLLRTHYGLHQKVIVLTVENIEHDQAYCEYFGL